MKHKAELGKVDLLLRGQSEQGSIYNSALALLPNVDPAALEMIMLGKAQPFRREH